MAVALAEVGRGGNVNAAFFPAELQRGRADAVAAAVKWVRSVRPMASPFRETVYSAPLGAAAGLSQYSTA